MLDKLVEFGRRIRKPGDSDALQQAFCSIDLIIDPHGKFIGFNVYEKQPTLAEAIPAKKGKARLLLDKPEETLGLEAKKHALFLAKLNAYAEIPSLRPALLFYGENKEAGLDKAVKAFEADVPQNERIGNIAFRLLNDDLRLHEKEDVTAAVIYKFEETQTKHKTKNSGLCSICGTADYPVIDQPHGMIKKVPAGQSSGSALISYNEDAFESYGLRGNENSSVCTACARNYVEGLNYLLGHGEWQQPEKGKPYLLYSNRKNLASDTAMIYWTKSGNPAPEIDFVDRPQEHEESITELLLSESPPVTEQTEEDLELLLQSPYSGNPASLKSVDADRFYSCILSGTAARIAVRSWIEATTSAVKGHIAAWFHDIESTEYDYDSGKYRVVFFPLRVLANSCGVHRKKDSGGKTVFSLDDKDDFLSRASTMLWTCALLGKAPPLSLLDRILRRIKIEEGRVTATRVALLKLILNRNIHIQQTGGRRMQPKLDPENMTIAYMAGRIFAMLERIQFAALGKKLNAPIRDRFFSSASTTPASAFGRLLKMSQNHLAKLRGEEPWLAVNLDKQLGELFTHVEAFPLAFTLEEQGRFAIGYYHQRQENFPKSDTQPEKGEDND